MLVPKLRFKREDGTDYPEWEKTKIGKLTKTFSASRVHREEWQTEGVPFWRSSDVMAFHQHKENAMGKAFITNELYEELSAKSGKMTKDDILITGGGSIGVPYLIPNNEPLYVKDADLLCIQKSDSHYPKFLYQFFWSPSFHNYLSVISHKGTIAHYTITQINETPIMMPCLEEQQKIADYLSAVDEVIAQSEAEVQNLEQQKKAAMQKIFSQEVRFKREDGTDYPDWEEKTVAEIFKITRGYVLSTKLVKSFADNEYCYPVFSSQTKDNGLMGYYNEYLYENAITWTTDGANAGTVRFRKGKFYCTNVCGVLLNETGFANQCIAEYLNSVAFKYVSYVGNPKLMNNIMAEIPIIIPCLEEQQKIADFLSAYDEAIRYAKQELDKWKELKKGLLQQMFV